MGTESRLSRLTWRKSSHSGHDDGNCVECAPCNGAAWRKSSYSDDEDGNCVEVSPECGAGVAIRDSKWPGGPQLRVGVRAFGVFVDAQR